MMKILQMKMQSTQMTNFFLILITSSLLVNPCYGESPKTPKEIKQDQSSISIQETLERAYMQNAALDAARAGLRAQAENVSQANAAWRPSLSVTGNQGLTQTNPINFGTTNTRGATTGYSAQIQQNVYQGGGSEATLAQQESNFLSGKAGLFSTEQQTLTNAVGAHTSVIASEDILMYQRQSEEFYRINLERARARFEVGEITLTDVATVEAAYESAKADVANAIANLETAKATYLNQVGSPPGKLAPANVILEVPKAYNDVIEIAREKNPAIIQAKYALDAAQYNVTVQASQLLPSVNVNASVGNQRAQANNQIPRTQKTTNFGFGTEVTVPIYLQGVPNSQVRQAYQTVAQNKVQVVQTTRQVEQDARSAWEALLAAMEAVKSRLASVKAQELAVEGAVEEANVGTKTYVDVRELEQELITQQIELVQAQQNLITQSYAVLSSMGRLTARDLSLRVKYYDADAYYKEYRDAWIQFWEGRDLRYVRDGDLS